MKRRYHLHIPGIVYSAVAIVIGVAAMNTQNNLLFWMFGVLVAGMLLSGLISGLMMMAIDVRRLDPQHGAVGEPLTVRYRIHNRRRWLPAFNLNIQEVPVSKRDISEDERTVPWQQCMPGAAAWAMHLGPGESTHADATYWPRHRGRVVFHRLRVSTTFPFGLIKKSITFSQRHHTYIFPMLHEMRRDLLRSIVPAGPVGIRSSEQVGSGGEYYGLREHRVGDSMRNISWKLTARFDTLMSIERTHPSPPKLRVVLNLTRPTERLQSSGDSFQFQRELEERAISIAASLIYDAHNREYEVGLSVLGSALPMIPTRRSRWHLGKMMAALASIELDARRLPVDRRLVPEAERAGAVVIHPARIEPQVAREGAIHFSAEQADRLTIGARGWDPGKYRVVDDFNIATLHAAPVSAGTVRTQRPTTREPAA